MFREKDHLRLICLQLCFFLRVFLDCGDVCWDCSVQKSCSHRNRCCGAHEQQNWIRERRMWTRANTFTLTLLRSIRKLNTINFLKTQLHWRRPYSRCACVCVCCKIRFANEEKKKYNAIEICTQIPPKKQKRLMNSALTISTWTKAMIKCFFLRCRTTNFRFFHISLPFLLLLYLSLDLLFFHWKSK